MLPSFNTILFPSFAPTNPSAAIFAGWLPGNEPAPGGVTQAVRLEQLSPEYTVTLDDHCYADNRVYATETTSVTYNSK